MTSKNINQRALGLRLSGRRAAQGLSQAAIAATAGISSGYYSEIENSKCVAPPRHTMERIFRAIGFSDMEICELEQLAAEERGLSGCDADLPEEVQALIKDIRKYANMLNPRFVKGLRAKIREVVT